MKEYTELETDTLFIAILKIVIVLIPGRNILVYNKIKICFVFLPFFPFFYLTNSYFKNRKKI